MLFFLVIDLQGFGQDTPSNYQKYFVHFNVENKTWWDIFLERIGYKNILLGRSYAIVAGIDYYPNMSPDSRYLKPAGKDIEKIVKYLKDDQKFDEIIVLKNQAVTPENLRYFLYEYIPEQIERKEKTRFLFAYSGHGMTQFNRGYLLKSNARSLDDRINSINLNSIKVYIDEIISVSHYNLVLINSCYSGYLQKNFW